MGFAAPGMGGTFTSITRRSAVDDEVFAPAAQDTSCGAVPRRPLEPRTETMVLPIIGPYGIWAGIMIAVDHDGSASTWTCWPTRPALPADPPQASYALRP